MHLDLCESVRVVRHPSAVATIVAFGGLRPQGGYVLPAFEFVRTLSELHYNVLFVRDLTQRWFNFGIPDFSKDMKDTATQIRVQIDRHFDPGLPLYTLGNSAGGYGAIYFGEALAADTALAIVPQTMIDLRMLSRFGHKGWAQMGQFDATVPDLRPAMTGKAGRVHVVVGIQSPEDVVHAGNIAGCGNVHIELVAGRHDVGRRWQEEDGGLARKISDRLRPRHPAAAGA